MGYQDVTYEPTDTIRFVTEGGNDLIGVIELMGETWALVKVEKPTPMEILLDLSKIIGKVTKL